MEHLEIVFGLLALHGGLKQQQKPAVAPQPVAIQRLLKTEKKKKYKYVTKQKNQPRRMTQRPFFQ